MGGSRGVIEIAFGRGARVSPLLQCLLSPKPRPALVPGSVSAMKSGSSRAGCWKQIPKKLGR
jgi:hypothetical protein